MYRREVLSNGIRFIAVPGGETEALTLLVLCGVGSRYEPARLAGASHFLEHMLFKGTKRRPSAGRISRELDAVGADYNAFTGKEYTGFYIRVHADRARAAAEMLHDMLTESIFKPAEMERERGVILEEINMYEDSPSAHAGEMLEALVYGACPLGRNIAGIRKTVAAMSRRDLMSFWRTHYVPANLVAAVSGRLEDGAAEAARRSFGRIRPARGGRRGFSCASYRKGGAKLELKFKETEQVQVALGFPGVAYGDPARPALALLSAILGGGMSSRLFTEVREKRGLAYTVGSAIASYHDAGDFTVHAGLSKEGVFDGLKVILRELGRAARRGVTAEELARGKEFLRGRITLGLETTMDLAEYHAKQELLAGRIEPVEEKVRRLMAVRLEEVAAAAARTFRTARLSAAVIGPFGEVEPFKRILTIPAR